MMTTPTIEEIKQKVAWQLAGINSETITPYVDERDDVLKENYTVVLFPNCNLKKLNDEVSHLKQIDDGLFYLDPSKWHITLIGEIDISTDQEKIIETIKKQLDGLKVEFEVNGFASNKSTASFLTYPDFDLHLFRDEVRNSLGLSGTDYTIHLSTYEYIGWINFVRYTSVPNLEFLRYLRVKKDLDLGDMSGSIKLLKNKSRTLKDGMFEIVYEF